MGNSIHVFAVSLKGYFKDLVLNKDLFGILGPYLYFRVLIFAFLASFTQRMSIQSVGKFGFLPMLAH